MLESSIPPLNHELGCVKSVLVFMCSEGLICIENLGAVSATIAKGTVVMFALNMIHDIAF